MPLYRSISQQLFEHKKKLEKNSKNILMLKRKSQIVNSKKILDTKDIELDKLFRNFSQTINLPSNNWRLQTLLKNLKKK